MSPPSVSANKDNLNDGEVATVEDRDALQLVITYIQAKGGNTCVD